MIEGRPGLGAPVLKRLLLAQGELAQIWDGKPPLQYLALMELRSGTVRGNHFHRLKHENIYVISGEVDLALQDCDSGARECIRLQAGDLAVIEPRIAHAYQVMAPGFALEFSPEAFDPSDSFPHPLA